MISTLLIGFIRTLFYLLDSIFYGLIGFFYDVIAELANVSFLSRDSMDSFANRVYILVGVFVLFKLSFSLIKNFADPDGFKDDKAGGVGVLKRFIIAMLLLVSVPLMFRLAFMVQYRVIESNIIGSLVIGDHVSFLDTDSDGETSLGSVGDKMSEILFSGFFTPAIDESGEYVCENIEIKTQPSMSNKDRVDLTTSDGDFCYNYSFLLSTLAGAFTAWIMMIFVLDIALRSAKLAVLQLIAPFPIIMSIDEKGGDALKTWIEETISTYVDLFVRLFIIFMITFLILEVTSGDNSFITIYSYDSTGNLPSIGDEGARSVLTNPLLGALVVLGILMFASKAPDLIYKMFGLKPPADGFTLNPLTKIGNHALAGAAVAGGVGLLGNAIGKTARNVKAKREKYANEDEEKRELDEDYKPSLSTRLGRGLSTTFSMGTGAVTGAATGGFGGVVHGSKGGNPLRGAEKSMLDSVQRARAKKQGYGAWSRMKDSAGSMIGVEGVFGTTDEFGDEIKRKKHENTIIEKQLRAFANSMNKDLAGLDDADVQVASTKFYDADTKKDTSAYSNLNFASANYDGLRDKLGNVTSELNNIRSSVDPNVIDLDSIGNDFVKLKRELVRNNQTELANRLERAADESVNSMGLDKVSKNYAAYHEKLLDYTKNEKEINAKEKTKGSFSKKD